MAVMGAGSDLQGHHMEGEDDDVPQQGWADPQDDI